MATEKNFSFAFLGEANSKKSNLGKYRLFVKSKK